MVCAREDIRMDRILIAEDNNELSNIWAKYLQKGGYEVVVVSDGAKALSYFCEHEVAMVLLDVMMPKMDGYEVCRQIRSRSQVPIMMLTARGEDFEKIMGLEIGADDYMVKPFSTGEMVARVNAVLRRFRHAQSESELLFVDNLVISLNSYEVRIAREKVLLSKRAVELLWTLASNPGQTFTRELLLDKLWGHEYYGDTRSVDSHIKRMRNILNKYDHPNWDIKTVWGVGYKFEVDENEKN